MPASIFRPSQFLGLTALRAQPPDKCPRAKVVRDFGSRSRMGCDARAVLLAEGILCLCADRSERFLRFWLWGRQV